MKQFSFQHNVALAVLVLGVAGSVWGARRHPGRWMRPFEVTLAGLICAAWAGEYVADVIQGTWSVQYTLPLQLTDAVSVASIVALLTRRQLFVELAYFWTFTASLQAVVTPDLAYAFPSVFYFTYFLYHVGAIVAAAYLVVGCRLYPRPGAAWRVFAFTLVWAAIAGLGDVITGGNYMYLRAKPVHASLLSVMSPWPWYIAEAAAVGLAMLLVVGALTPTGARRPR
ncbi:MAG TPA: TIGR02206 family membrane protein [Solirubrobacteraceae bacterium]